VIKTVDIYKKLKKAWGASKYCVFVGANSTDTGAKALMSKHYRNVSEIIIPQEEEM
jgi:hypothetical protein